jgi:hypothetical protein
VGGYIGWVRVNNVEVAKTGHFDGQNGFFVALFVLKRVGSCKNRAYFSLFFLVLLEYTPPMFGEPPPMLPPPLVLSACVWENIHK